MVLQLRRGVNSLKLLRHFNIVVPSRDITFDFSKTRMAFCVTMLCISLLVFLLVGYFRSTYFIIQYLFTLCFYSISNELELYRQFFDKRKLQIVISTQNKKSIMLFVSFQINQIVRRVIRRSLKLRKS